MNPTISLKSLRQCLLELINVCCVPAALGQKSLTIAADPAVANNVSSRLLVSGLTTVAVTC